MRRLEALTGDAARAYLSEQEARLKDIASALHVRPEDAAERVKALIEERKQLERQLAEAKKQIAMGGGGKDAGPAIVEVGGRKFLKLSVTGVEMKDLKAMADDGRAKIGSGIVAIVGVTEDGKAGLAVGVTDDKTGSHSAVDLVKAGAAALGGQGGGGRPDMAQGGGPDGSKASEALEAVRGALEKVAA